MAANRFTIQTHDGWVLAAEEFLPPGEPKGLIVLGHAMMCGRRTLDRPRGGGLASRWAELGHVVITWDCRGHGDSGPGASRQRDWTYDDIMIDIEAAIRAGASRHPGLRLVLAGHSLTAHAGVALLGQKPHLPVHGMVSLAGNVWLRRFEPELRYWLKKRAQMEFVWGITKRLGYFPARALRLGPDNEPRSYFGQFIQWVRHNRWTSADGQVDYLEGAGNIRIPILSIAGAGDDLMCRPVSAEKFIRAAVRNAPVSCITASRQTVPGLSIAPGHMELVTSTASRPIWDLVGRWCGEQVFRNQLFPQGGYGT